MPTKRIAIFATFLGTSLALIVLVGRAQDGASVTPPAVPSPGVVGRIAGEFVMIRTGPAEEILTLEKPSIQRLGERDFIVGLVAIPRQPMRAYEGKRMWVPVSAVVEMLELKSIAEATAILTIPNSEPRNQVPAQRPYP